MQRKTTNKRVTGGSSGRWQRDDLKEAFWRKHIAAWQESGQSKRGYCTANNISETGLYAWIREARARDRENTPVGGVQAPLLNLATPGKNPFVPLQLLPDQAGQAKTAIRETDSPLGQTLLQRYAAKPTVDIIVPGGAVLRVDESCNLEFIATLFSTLKGQPQC